MVGMRTVIGMNGWMWMCLHLLLGFKGSSVCLVVRRRFFLWHTSNCALGGRGGAGIVAIGQHASVIDTIGNKQAHGLMLGGSD